MSPPGEGKALIRSAASWSLVRFKCTVEAMLQSTSSISSLACSSWYTHAPSDQPQGVARRTRSIQKVDLTALLPEALPGCTSRMSGQHQQVSR